MRQHIIEQIKKIAFESGGKPPGQELFVRLTGIKRSVWLGHFWARWGDALQEAGFEPNEFQEKAAEDSILSKVVQACRHYGKLPTTAEFRMYRKIDPNFPTFDRRFPTKAELSAALSKWALAKGGHEDIFAMLPELEALSQLNLKLSPSPTGLSTSCGPALITKSVRAMKLSVGLKR